MPRQAKALSRYAGSEPELPNGIFLTHVPVYAMPRMRNYLTTNGPWSQLVSTGNIILQPLTADSTIRLTPNLTVTPFRVPHRDEYSETVGYRIDGPAKSCLSAIFLRFRILSSVKVWPALRPCPLPISRRYISSTLTIPIGCLMREALNPEKWLRTALRSPVTELSSSCD